MTISMYDVSATTYLRMLANAKAWLDLGATYAAEKRFDPQVLVDARLAPDMLPLSAQIQIATDHAKGSVARLAGIESPRFADDEKTLEELKARIDKCVSFLKSVTPEQLEGSETREIVLSSPRGERRFVGQPYLLEYALPNFYFHITTAYAILRHNGVAVGKKLFLTGEG